MTESAHTAARSPAPHPHDATIHVLCVDDDPEIVDIMRDFLERDHEEFVVHGETSPGTALSRLRDDAVDIDCVVADYDMPGITGLELLDAVNEHHPDLPFILLTGKGDEDLASQAISRGVTDYLQKQYDPEQYTVLANKVKQAVEQATIRTQRRRYFNAIETTQEGLSILNADGEFIYVNEAFADLYGYAPEELIDNSWEMTYPESEVEYIRTEIFPTVTEKGKWRGTTTGVRRDGSTFTEDHLISKTPKGDYICAVRDISDQVKREKAIRSLHTATRDLMVADSRKEVAEITVTAAEEILGFPYTVVRYLQGEELVPVVLSDGVREEVGPDRPSYAIGEPTAGLAFAKQETVVYEDLEDHDELDESNDHTSGGSMYVPIGEYGVLTVSDTEPDAFDQTDVDLAEILTANAETALSRVERTEEMQLRNERLDRFASVVSHDLRNPLNVAEGRLELAREECESEHFDSLANALTRMEELIDDLLLLAQEGGGLSEHESVDLTEIADECWEIVHTASATLQVTTDCTVQADSSQLKELLENLFRNAIDHGGNNVTVEIGHLDGDQRGFYVADDGPGIPPDERDRVFESGYSTVAGGTGLGLSIVHEIAESHNWKITVTDSEAGGARFEFYNVSLSEQ